jgi:hypothetical protein
MKHTRSLLAFKRGEIEMTYKVVIPDSSYLIGVGQCTKCECDHNHRTYSGARRCLDKLAVYYPDGSHNGWAHYGTVWEYGDDGVGRVVDWDTEIEYEDRKHEDTIRAEWAR